MSRISPMHLNRLELNELSDCTCLRLRMVTRRVTQIYDQILATAGVTASQFGLLVHLYDAAGDNGAGIPLGVLAERLSMDHTTLNRNLKPLENQALLASQADANDRRVRLIHLTEAGVAILLKALPFWHQARDQVRQEIGMETTTALNSLLALSTKKLAVGS